MNTPKSYCVARYDAKGNRWVVGGCGKNKGSHEWMHSQRAAQRNAKRLREIGAARGETFTYKVEPI